MSSLATITTDAVARKRVTSLMLASCGALWLVGCATTNPPTDPPASAAPSGPALSTFDQWLGSYRSLDETALNLEITREPQAPALTQTRRYVWTQWADGSEATPRRFVITMDHQGESLESSFAPLTEQASRARRCPINWQMTTGALGQPAVLGLTTATECRFPQAEGELGLVKEWSFDGKRIQVADQLVDMTTGEPRQEPQLIEFVRVQRYTGWAAVADGDAWRVDEGVVALTDGQRRATRDAADMPLGIAITLERQEATGSPSLHLVISEAETGEVLGQAWSASDADKIGWANEHIQVELTQQIPD